MAFEGSRIGLIDIFQFDPHQLSEYRLLVCPLPEEEPGSELAYYAEVRHAYLLCDLPRLERLARTEGFGILSLLARLRYEVRLCNPSRRLIDEVLAWTETSSDPLLRGECQMVAANALHALDLHVESKPHYFAAFQQYEAAGAQRLSLLALQNYVAAESRIHPRKRMVADYEFVARRAIQLGEPHVAGQAYVNISRECQVLGALELALSYANKAVSFLEPSFGNLTYFFAIAHRCHVHIDLGNETLAASDLQLLSLAEFPEIKGVQKILTMIRNGKADPVDETVLRTLTVTWRQRLQGIQPVPRQGGELSSLTAMEAQLISMITARACSKDVLVRGLYGDKIDLESAENRLRVLVARLRKKRPGMILSKNGLYFLSENEGLLTSGVPA